MIKNIFTTILFLFFILVFPKSTFSASLFFEKDESAIKNNNLFEVDVFVDTEGLSFNAISGDIIFPQYILSFVDTKTFDSGISLWYEKPYLKNNGSISFSGIIPGGRNGSMIKIMTIVFESKKSGVGNLSAENIIFLANDGQGTSIPISIKQHSVSVDFQKKQNKINETGIVQKDTEAPESFTPFMVKDKNLFSGRPVLVFNTIDKQSSLLGYKIKIGELGFWRKASSPQALLYRNQYKTISIMAIDENGNQRIEKIIPEKNFLNIFYKIIGGFVLFGVILCIRFLFKRFYE